jgi:hypothetical protein
VASVIDAINKSPCLSTSALQERKRRAPSATIFATSWPSKLGILILATSGVRNYYSSAKLKNALRKS